MRMVRLASLLATAIALDLLGVPSAGAETPNWQEIENAANARKAAYEADKAASEAELAALQARLGPVAESAYSGSVTPGTGTGTAEAMLLAARAVKTAAEKIVARIAPRISGHEVFLYPAAAVPTFDALLAYRARTEFVRRGFEEAFKKAAEAERESPAPVEDNGMQEVAQLAAAGLGLEALDRLFGYLRSDYTTAGVGLTVEDSLLVAAVAAELTAPTTPEAAAKPTATPSRKAAPKPTAAPNPEAAPKQVFHEPQVFDPEVLARPAAGILSTLAELAELRRAALTRATGLAETHAEAAAALRSAAAGFDALFGQLTDADETTKLPIGLVVREAALADALAAGGRLLVVRVHAAAGSFYTVKNLWSFFGGQPLRHMGGVVVSFTLFEGATGQVLDAGVVPVHGGFVKAGDVQSTVEK